MSMYDVQSFDDCGKLFAEVFQNFTHINDTLGRSTSRNEHLFQQFADIIKIQAEQSKIIDRVEGGQQATMDALNGFKDEVKQIRDDMSAFKAVADVVKVVQSTYMTSDNVVALVSGLETILNEIREQTKPVIEEQRVKELKRKQYADAFEKWKISKLLWVLNGLLVCLVVGMIFVGSYYFKAINTKLDNTRADIAGTHSDVLQNQDMLEKKP